MYQNDTGTGENKQMGCIKEENVSNGAAQEPTPDSK